MTTDRPTDSLHPRRTAYDKPVDQPEHAHIQANGELGREGDRQSGLRHNDLCAAATTSVLDHRIGSTDIGEEPDSREAELAWPGRNKQGSATETGSPLTRPRLSSLLLRRGTAPSLAVRWSTGLLAGITAVAALTAAVVAFSAYIPESSVLVLYLLVIVPVAIVYGTRLAVVTAMMCAAVYDYFLTPPLDSFHIEDPQNVIALGIFLITALVVGELAAGVRRAAGELARLYQEQSALLRVATRAAQSISPAPVFEAVSRELGMLCRADLAEVARYEQDGTATRVAAWSKVAGELAVGARLERVGPIIAREVQRTGAPARICSFAGSAGPIASEARKLGIRATIGCPIVVAGRLWGVFVAATKSKKPFPPGTESRIATFTDIVATAILTTGESRAELATSRARVVAAADEVRRRLGRDLHDGTQQRLVSVGLRLRLARDALPAELSTVRADLGQVAEELNEAQEELRELACGLHPAILSQAGLVPALRKLARRSALPVTLHIHTEARYPAPVELSAFYVVSEALTNTIKHANASHVEVVVEDRDGLLAACVRDDGVGGADPRSGSGLIGLRDRVEAIGGSMQISSPAGRGTTIQITLPTGGWRF